MGIFISEFLRKEVDYLNKIYLYPIYDDFTFSSLEANALNWKRKAKILLSDRNIVAIVIVYRVSENIVSQRCVSRNKLSIKVIENSIKLKNILNLLNIIGDKQ